MIGIADTAYLSYFEYLHLVPSCSIGGCATVLTSPYAKFFEVPLAYIGLVYYVYMLALAALLAMEPRSRALSIAALGYTLVGLTLSAIFEFYIQGVLIGEYCMYCGISALTTLALFVTAIRHWIKRTQI